MNKPQIIKSPSGDELVVLPRDEYNNLVARAAEPDDEDAALARVAKRELARLKAAGETLRYPAAVAEAIANGENRIRAIRKWRGLSQVELAAKAGTDQGTISALEAGRRRGPVAVLQMIARALEVRLEEVVPEPLPGSLSG
jgi:DNA-binding XRE family transcriptional regulator